MYIAEAHAQNKWPVSSGRYNGDRGPVCIEEAQSNEDRCVLAAAFARNYGFSVPTLADPVEKEDGTAGEDFERLFAPWPIRFYVVSPDDKMMYIAQPDSCEVSLPELRAFLLRLCGRPMDM